MINLISCNTTNRRLGTAYVSTVDDIRLQKVSAAELKLLNIPALGLSPQLELRGVAELEATVIARLVHLPRKGRLGRGSDPYRHLGLHRT